MEYKIRPKINHIFILLLTAVFLIAGGAYYITNTQHSLWTQSVSNILEATSQMSHAFEICARKDAEILHNFANKLSQKKSGDAGAIWENLSIFCEEDVTYAVIDLEHGLLWTNQEEGVHEMDESSLQSYRELPKSGYKEPFLDEFTGQKTAGCFERFEFADGTQGIIQKRLPVSEIANDFSLPFYEVGLYYIVNKKGDILICSQYENNDRVFQNIFDVIGREGNDEEIVAEFRRNLLAGNKGAARFLLDGREYFFAYVPIDNMDGWFMVSMIPNHVLMEYAGKTLKRAQALVYVIGIGLFIGIGYWVLIRQNGKSVREKEVEIQYREQLFNILAVNTDDVFLMLSAEDCTVEYVSPNVERILGFTQNEVKADVRTLGKGTYNNGMQVDYASLKKIAFDKSLVLEGERIHNKTGERRCFLETIYRARIDNADRLIAVLSDRTEERKSRKALEEALSIARVANASKSIFLSNMSHDIRTPMNAIVGLSTLLQRDAETPEKVREHIKKITASSQHLLGLINDILDMGKIENGKTTLNVTEINLAEIIDELGIIMRPQAKAKQQRFNISAYDIYSEHLLGDKIRINQVLINILSNAVKYTPVGGNVDMIIRQLSQKTPNYACFQFIVKDNGIGMSEDYLKTIFDPFTREVNSTTNAVQGTGLGMAITKNLVDLMGGTIDVESAPGQGSTFTVYLELRIKEQDADTGFWRRHGVTHALIVDDEEDICTNIIGVMKETEVSTETPVSMEYAADGHSAIAMIQDAHDNGCDFDLVLLDWKMPDMDGIETAENICRILPENTPIMLLTDCDWSGIEEEAADAAGIKGFLSKPFFLSNLKQSVERLKNTEDTQDNAVKEGALKGKHFLVAEDNELNSEILSELLDMSEATCDIAVNGLSAFEMFENSRAGKYDMILMDVQMPVMNGYEATRAIRNCSHPHAKTIPIIAMTANAFAEDVRDALDAGMDAHIAKPVDMGRLEIEIAEIFARGVIH